MGLQQEQDMLEFGYSVEDMSVRDAFKAGRIGKPASIPSKKLIENQELLDIPSAFRKQSDWKTLPSNTFAELAPVSAPKPRTEGEVLRDAGKARAAAARHTALKMARYSARRIALGRDDRTCAADDVHGDLSLWDMAKLGNAAGSIFKGKEWELVGYRKSRQASAHARRIAVWRLK